MHSSVTAGTIPVLMGSLAPPGELFQVSAALRKHKLDA